MANIRFFVYLFMLVVITNSVCARKRHWKELDLYEKRYNCTSFSMIRIFLFLDFLDVVQLVHHVKVFSIKPVVMVLNVTPQLDTVWLLVQEVHG